MANGQEEEWRRVTRERERKKSVCVMGYACHMINSAHGIQSTSIGLTNHASTHLSVILWWTSSFVFLFSIFLFVLQPNIRCSRSINPCPSSADVDVSMATFRFLAPCSRSLNADIACASKWRTTHETGRTTIYIYTYTLFCSIFFSFSLLNWSLHNRYTLFFLSRTYAGEIWPKNYSIEFVILWRQVTKEKWEVYRW